MRFHVDVLVKGRADKLVIARRHMDLVAAARYERQLKLTAYEGITTECNDSMCRDFDITEGD